MSSKIVTALLAITLGSTGAYAATEAVKACCCDKDKMAADKAPMKMMPAPAPAPAPKK